MFFDKAWSEVTDEEMNMQADKLASEMGGWIFHSKVDFSKPTPHLTIDRGHSPLVSEWIERNK